MYRHEVMKDIKRLQSSSTFRMCVISDGYYMMRVIFVFF